MAKPQPSLKRRKDGGIGSTLFVEGTGMNQAIVAESTNGVGRPSAIICNCPTFIKKKPGHARWCIHVEKVYREQLDAKVFQMLTKTGEPAEARLLPPMIDVTIFVKQGLILTASLDDEDNNGLRKVYVLKSSSLESEPPEFVGFVGRGEGRYRIRNMMQEWIIESIEITSTHSLFQCPSPFHFGERTIQPADPPIPNEYARHLTQVASILTTGFCQTCALDSYVPEVD